MKINLVICFFTLIFLSNCTQIKNQYAKEEYDKFIRNYNNTSVSKLEDELRKLYSSSAKVDVLRKLTSLEIQTILKNLGYKTIFEKVAMMQPETELKKQILSEYSNSNIIIFPEFIDVYRLEQSCPDSFYTRQMRIFQQLDDDSCIVFFEKGFLISANDATNIIESNEKKFDNVILQKKYDFEKIKIAKLNEKIKLEEKLLSEKLRLENQKVEAENFKRKEKCLNDGLVGVCQTAENGSTRFICGNNFLTALDNLLNPYCYYSDEDTVNVNLELRNNLKRPIADIQIRCDQIARSGTVLDRGGHTAYDIWHHKETKSLSLRFRKHEQMASIVCVATKWVER